MSGRESDLRTLPPGNAVFPPPNITRYLLPKEEVRYLDRRHPVVLAVPAVLAVVVCLVAGFLVTAVGAGPVLNLYLWIVVGAIGWLLFRILRWARTVLVVTNRRVFEVESMLISRAAIRPVFRQSVVFRQDPIGERLNYGTILTETANGERVNTFKWIHNPQVFYRAVTDKAV